jgi:prepilin-type N-terminal cleavage/methylation domain-containing protein
MIYRKHRPFFKGGFTLVELAIVLVVVSLLLVALMGPLAAQQEQKSIMDTRRQMDEAREALFGFLVANGRLPCPADPALNTTNANAGLERAGGCATVATESGVLPWRALGLKETDAWGHRFSYRVTSNFAVPPTITTNGTVEIYTDATAATRLTNSNEVAAVIVSHGRHADGAWGSDGSQLAASADADEAENSDGDTDFVDHSNTATQPNSPYDDLLVWVPRNLVFNKLIAAGRLP